MATPTSSFSTGDDVIHRKIDCLSSATSTECLHEVYELDRCTAWISEHGFKRVALQFPDELLEDAPIVTSNIQKQVKDAVVFILGDTSYGSCCVDEVGAQHHKADCIIHFGRSCLSPTGRLPVLYIFGRSEIDTEDCVQQLTKLLVDTHMKTVLVYDTVFLHAVGEVFSKLKNSVADVVLSGLLVPKYGSSSTDHGTGDNHRLSSCLSDHMQDSCSQCQCQGQPCSELKDYSVASSINQCGRTIKIPPGNNINEYSFIFIGDTETAAITNLMMTFNKNSFYSYNPAQKQCRKETLNVNKALMKRYYLVERAKDARIVGIVVGTLGVAKYRAVIEHLKEILKKAGKKSYTFVVGKLNPAKLANFAEINVYVLVACPESTLFDQSEFYCPIVSPLEMELACNQLRKWTGEYSTDFRDILPGAPMYVKNHNSSESEDYRADVSLVTNRVRVLGTREVPAVGVPSQDLVLRSEAMTVAAVSDNAAEYLASRTWKGLEQKLGETPVVKAVEGQHGIAASYQHESPGI